MHKYNTTDYDFVLFWCVLLEGFFFTVGGVLSTSTLECVVLKQIEVWIESNNHGPVLSAIAGPNHYSSDFTRPSLSIPIR